MSSDQLPAGLPGWRRGDCLGCWERVTQARDAWVSFGGTRSGSWTIMSPARPFQSLASDPYNIPNETMYLLGVAHRDCAEEAHRRLSLGGVVLPEDLPFLMVEMDVKWDEADEPNLHLPVTGDACLFCGSRNGLTDEHVWPEWFIAGVPRGTTAVVNGVARRLRDLIVPACGDCNNRWMSVLENDAKTIFMPMLGNQRTSLTHDARELLATWATMKAYEIDAATTPVVPRGYLYELRNTRRPSHGVSAWLGAYTPDVHAAAWVTHHRFPALVSDDPLPANGFAITFSVYQVLFHLVGHFVTGPGVVWREDGSVADALTPLWPADSATTEWPLGWGFSSDSIDILVNSVAARVHPPDPQDPTPSVA